MEKVKPLPEDPIQREALLRATFENAALGIAVLGLDGQWIQVNEKLCTFLGYSRDELIKLTLQDITHHDDLATDLQKVKAIVDGEISTYTTEKRYLRKDGSVIWAQLTVVSAQNAEGKTAFFVSFVQDISARKEAEAHSRESEQRLKALVNGIPNLAWMAQPNGWIFWYNEPWYHYTGTTPEQMAGWGWKSVHDPEKLPSVLKRWESSILSGQSFEMIFPLRRADGVFRRFLTRVVPLRNSAGQIDLWFGTNTDVEDHAALQKSEDRYRAFVQATADLVYRMNPDWSALVSAEGGDFILDAKADHSWLEKNIYPDDRAKILAEIAVVCRTKEVFSIEHRVIRPDGSVGWTLSRAIPILDESGEIIEWFGVARDITEKKRADEEMERLVQERTAALRAALTEMEEFSYSMSHDLRSPLRSIAIFSKILLEEAGPQLQPEYLNYLERIQRSATRMDSLVVDVLSLAKISRANIELEPINLDLVVKDVLYCDDRLQPPLARVLVGHLGMVLGHGAFLAQVFSNLLVNAVKFVREGQTPNIEVWATVSEGFTRVWIRDNGIGIPPAHQRKLFKMFERLKTEKVYEGTGIGLAIAAKAVSRMNGRIGVESDGVNGSTFWVDLRQPNYHLT